MTKFADKYGPWALVTGASGGIGTEFTRQLAVHGLNLVITARKEERLAPLAEELRKQHGIEVRIVAADLAGEDYISVLDKATADLEIGLVVNNAGMVHHGDFVENDAEAEKRLARVNMIAPLAIARHFGAALAQRGRGGILFVSSSIAYGPAPYLANYAASKSYLLTLGESRSYEFKQHGVDVTVLSPGPTRTPMTDGLAEAGMDFTKTPFTFQETAPVVRAGLAALGRKASVIPGARNNIMAFAGKYFTPRGIAIRAFGGILKRAGGIGAGRTKARKRAAARA